tara:strand:- start:902 stop:1717 length:816 start_codon:yes stop_codon:yes gene_type:complete
MDIKHIRFEASFKSIEKLSTMVKFYDKYQINNINIPCKSYLKKDLLNKSIEYITNRLPNISLIPHYSLFYQSNRNLNQSLDYLKDFIRFSLKKNVEQVLIISGSKKKSNIDTLIALQHLIRIKDISERKCIGIAYNPYLKREEANIEKLRLEEKISSGLISSIWLQFGIESELLDKGIMFIERMISKYKYSNNPINIYGSVFIPSRKFLASFKFRSWKGIYLSEEFLDSPERARDITRNLLIKYRCLNIIPFIESNVSKEKDLTYLTEYFE